MSYKLNKKAIENYSSTLVALILNQAFYTKDYLGGKEISVLTPASQINVFILKILFEKWNDQAQKLRSKYFDFTHPDVESALQVFKNKLSHHIKVDKETFAPLLEQAIKDSLSLVFDPRAAVKTLFLSDANTYKEQLKFLKIHPELVKMLVNIKEASLEELHAATDAWENFTKPQELLAQTSNIHKAIVEDFVIDEPEPTIISVPEPTPTIVVPQKKTVVADDEMRTVNDLFSANQSTQQSLASQFQERQRIDSLQSGININQRFLFIKELFEGNSEEYLSTIAQLDSLGSLDDAKRLLERHAALKYNWKDKEEAVGAFFDVLSKKF